jgi:thymidylate synthase ThyX
MPYSVRGTSAMSSESLRPPAPRTETDRGTQPGQRNETDTDRQPAPRNQTEVFAIHGADPEILAYAMAKYSRSALSMRESLSEISSQRAEQFLNTFYFQYGHRSIADLAHIAFAVERLSLMAAIVLVDEPRWDGQERSTRYQNFLKSGWYIPDFGRDSASAQLYSQTIDNLFTAYQNVNAAVLELMRQRVPRPEAMKQDAYERTLRARAFDIGRYLLPLATNTSLGQIVSARGLEMQVSRLLSHPAAEIRYLGTKLREAATGPAWNVNLPAAQALIKKIAALERPPQRDPMRESPREAQRGPQPMPLNPYTNQPDEEWDAQSILRPDARNARPDARIGGDDAEFPEGGLAVEAAALFTRDVHTAPTLVKYAQPSEYLVKSQSDLRQAARELLHEFPSKSPLHAMVDLVERTESLEVELAATLLYSACHLPYRSVRDQVMAWPSARVAEIVELGLRHRGKHDEALRAFHAGAALRFDILMDIGGFRDMHRHRRCTQIIQGFTAEHGYEDPGSGDLPQGPDGKFDILAEAGARDEYRRAIESAHKAAAQIAAGPAPEAAQSACYLFPLATRIRALFKMDFAEAQYISELRTGPAGHFSYRRVAWLMYEALRDRHPSLAHHIRVTDFNKPIDVFQR